MIFFEDNEYNLQRVGDCLLPTTPEAYTNVDRRLDCLYGFFTEILTTLATDEERNNLKYIFLDIWQILKGTTNK